MFAQPSASSVTYNPHLHRFIFDPYKPEFFHLSNMVEVQVSFQVVRVGRHDYVFVPKLRAMCLLDREAESVCLTCLRVNLWALTGY